MKYSILFCSVVCAILLVGRAQASDDTDVFKQTHKHVCDAARKGFNDVRNSPIHKPVKPLLDRFERTTLNKACPPKSPNLQAAPAR